MNIPRIIIADDHPLCRSGLSALLRDRFDIGELVQAGDFRHALAALAGAPQTTIMTVDMTLPWLDGVAGLHRLRAEFPSLLLVVVAESRDREQVLAVLCAGVHGYILKVTPPDEISRAFEAILSGEVYVPPLVCDGPPDGNGASAGHASARKATLTERQFEVLQLVAAGRSNKEIARALVIAESTVKVHVNAAFRALGVHNRVSATAALQHRPSDDQAAKRVVTQGRAEDSTDAPRTEAAPDRPLVP